MRILIFLVVLLFVTSCNSTKNNNIDKNEGETLFLMDRDSLFVYYIFETEATKKNNYESVELNLYNKINNELLLNNKLDLIFENLFQTNKDKVKSIKIFYAGFSNQDLKGINYDEINAQFSLKINGKNKKFTTTPQKYESISEATKFLRIFPGVVEISPNTLELQVFAIRTMPRSGEYLPSSEHLRIFMQDVEQKTFFNSSKERDFLQALFPVEPVNVGNHFLYKTNIQLPKNYILNGMNKITYTIPSKPTTYQLQTNYWKK